jgi:hypothetical protein
MPKKLPRAIIETAHDAGIMGIKAGAKTDHRWVGVWPIVVDGRLFARSWTMRRDGWCQAFLDDPLGTIQVGGREIRIKARRVSGERLRDKIEAAYAEKYDTRSSQKYVRGFRTPRRRDTTTEFVPR